MCYGSGCSKENHMGDCSCFLTRKQEEMLKESKYKSTCLLYRAENILMDFYLTMEEYLKIDWAISKNDFTTIKEFEKLAYDRWRNDKERLDLIKRLECEE